MNLRTSGNRISGLLALMLFLIFSICILGVLLSTADAYQRLSERNALSGDRRTGMMFVSTKVHQSDLRGRIHAGDFDGTRRSTSPKSAAQMNCTRPRTLP